jgi:hypothetical protein
MFPAALAIVLGAFPVRERAARWRSSSPSPVASPRSGRSPAATSSRSAGGVAPLAALGIAITIIGIPYAVYKFVCWQFVQQEILVRDKRVRDAFRGSSSLVRRRWWHAVRALGFFWLLSIASGPVLGFALIFTNLSLFWINVIGSVVFALLVPYVALGRTLLYFDLQERAEEEPAKRWRERLPRRAAVAEV